MCGFFGVFCLIQKWVLASSPQSTLCAVDGKRNEAALDLLYAAAGEVAKMRMNDDRIELYNHHRGFFNPNPKPQHPVIGAITPKPSLSHLQYQKAQVSFALCVVRIILLISEVSLIYSFVLFGFIS